MVYDYKFIFSLCLMKDFAFFQLGVYVVSVVSGVAGDQLLPHLGHLLTLFSTTLDDTTSPTAFHTIQALTNFAPLVGQENMVGSFMSLLSFYFSTSCNTT